MVLKREGLTMEGNKPKHVALSTYIWCRVILYIGKLYIYIYVYICILNFKLSPCSECCLFSFGWFPGVWFIYADVSEHFICSIFKGRCEVTSHLPLKMEQIECSETSAYIIQTPGNHPKENKNHIYIYMCVCVYVCIYVYVYIYIYNWEIVRSG